MTMTPSPPISSPTPAPAAAAPIAKPPSAKRRWQRFAPDTLPKLVGYGLLVLFALDMAQAFAAYRPFHPEDDQALIVQVLERVALPLVAYVLIFFWDAPTGSRFELRVRKLISMASLALVFGCIGLAVMAVHSGFRLQVHATAAFDQQHRERTANLQRLANDLPGMSPVVVQATYEELVRRGLGQLPAARPSTDEMRHQIAIAVPLAIAASQSTSRQNTAQARTLQYLLSGKYFLGGVVSAVLFFLVWDTTAAARQFAFFGRRNDPSLTPSERIDRIIETFRIVPDLEEYHWYRRCKREWRLWREKRAARSGHSQRPSTR